MRVSPGWQDTDQNSAHMLFRKHTKTIENILIVEDEPLVAFDNEWHVSDAGYRVAATVDTVDEALAALNAHTIHLVIADIRLACGGSGTDVAEVAHQAGIPVLYATGACPVEHRRFAIGCLNKPYSSRELVRAIQAVDEILRGETPKAMPKSLSLYLTG